MRGKAENIMTIIKPGKRFYGKCGCGCEFSATVVETKLWGDNQRTCECPECGQVNDLSPIPVFDQADTLSPSTPSDTAPASGTDNRRSNDSRAGDDRAARTASTPDSRSDTAGKFSAAPPIAPD